MTNPKKPREFWLPENYQEDSLYEITRQGKLGNKYLKVIEKSAFLDVLKRLDTAAKLLEAEFPAEAQSINTMIAKLDRGL